MPAVLRRINRIFRRNSREQQRGDNNNQQQQGDNNQNQRTNPSSNNNQRHVNLARHMLHHHRNRNNNNHESTLSLNGGNNDISAPIKLRSHGFKRLSDGSVTLHVTLDKDQVECCVCLLSMTKKIYRCKGNGKKDANGDDKDDGKVICHNICGSCEWQMRRMKSGNGHTKEMQCPMCKVKGQFIRNRALERQLAELLQTCKYNKYGCDQVFFPWDSDPKKIHEQHLCIYQSVDCPFCYQTIPGGRCNFIEHLVKSAVKYKKSINQSQHIHDPMDDDDNIDEEIEEDNDEEMAETEVDEDEDEADIDDIDDESENMEPEDLDDPDIADIDDEEDEDLDGDEEKEQVNIDDMDINDNDEDDDKTSDNYVPPCLLNWMEAGSAMDIHHNSKFLISNNDEMIIKNGINQFIVNYNLGVIICFIAPNSENPCYKIYAISISPRHDLGGNSRIYIQYYDDDKMNSFMEKEQNMGLITQSLVRPIQQTLILTLGRLHPTTLRKIFKSYPEHNEFIPELNKPQIQQKKSILSTKSEEMKENDDNDNDDEMRDLSPAPNGNGNRNTNVNSVNVEKKMDEETEEEDKTNDLDDENEEYDQMDLWELQEYKPEDNLGNSPCTPLQCGYIFGGYGIHRMENIGIRMFTLEESLKVGSIIDARDFTGKWYQAEIISVQDFDGIEYVNLDCDNDDYLEIRKAKIHYLGYSQNYDEWLNVDTDSHRIAQRGTFTIGPDLRAIRRNTTNLNHHHSSSNNGNNNNNSNNNNPSSSSNNRNNNNISSISRRNHRSSRNNHNNHSSNNNHRNNRDRDNIIQRIPVVDIDEDEEDD